MKEKEEEKKLVQCDTCKKAYSIDRAAELMNLGEGILTFFTQKFYCTVPCKPS